MSFLNDESFSVRSSPKTELLNGKKKASTSFCLSVFKWIMTTLIFFTTLLCLILSKLTIISLSHKLNFSNTTDRNSIIDTKMEESDVAFTLIVLSMMIPHVISFTRTFYASAFSSNQPWPGGKALLVGIVSAGCEATGLSLLVLIVFSVIKNFIFSLLLMNGVFMVPLMFLFISQIRELSPSQFHRLKTTASEAIPMRTHNGSGNSNAIEDSRKKKSILEHCILIVSIAAVILTLTGFVGLIVALSFEVRFTISCRVIIPVSIILISIAWTPQVLERQTQPSDENLVNHDLPITDEPSLNRIVLRTARSKMTLISSFIKIVVTLVVSILLDYYLINKSTPGPMVFTRGIKLLISSNEQLKMLMPFLVHVLSSFMVYLAAWTSFKVNLQKICFVFPFAAATPTAILLVLLTGTWTKICPSAWLIASGGDLCVEQYSYRLWMLVVLGCFWLAGLCLSFQFFKSQQFLMAKEEVIFWLPTYDSVLVEQHTMLNRKNEYTDERYINYRQIVKDSRVYICTTMYHEADYEMEQLLESIAKIDEAGNPETETQSGRNFEAHIFFDDGARGNIIKKYALQLLSLLKTTVKVDPVAASMMETPYGLQLRYSLPHGMLMVLHLKDNFKVKNKKRWSQVMYMSYILDYKCKDNDISDDLCYILATDADVRFSHKDVESLMDVMSRDHKIAAVCGRTYPKGSGFLVWYQMFDYAIGHWLQKVTNHVLGTVLCSPGCFSVYRARAVRDVLPTYSSGVTSPMDFLTKDMGEDRWFCTLLVESGWKLEYCALAKDSTYCPEEFNEFFKQRRRWGPSTFANQIVLMNKQRNIRQNNDSINLFFMSYQIFQMLASIIGPSSVLLLMAGGLHFAFDDFSMTGTLIVLVLVTIGFAVVCMRCTGETQLKVAKVLTFIFAILMVVTTVGCVTRIAVDVNVFFNCSTYLKTCASSPNNITCQTICGNNYFTTHLTSLYIFLMVAIFIATGLLHGTEAFTLVYGVLYWLALPSGHLLLTIYSIANLTDRSWGTREGKFRSQSSSGPSWREFVYEFALNVCWCCIPPEFRSQQTEMSAPDIDGPDYHSTQIEEENIINEEEDNDSDKEAQIKVTDELGRSQNMKRIQSSSDDLTETICLSPPQPTVEDSIYSNTSVFAKKKPRPAPRPRKPHNIALLSNRQRANRQSYRFQATLRGNRGGTIYKQGRSSLISTMCVEEVLPPNFHIYIDKFKQHGYDNASFIAGMIDEKDLVTMGITNPGHRKKIMVAVEQLPPTIVLEEVPDDVEGWLINLGLEQYWQKFKSSCYTEQSDLADLKYMPREEISDLFDIKKEGHLRKLVQSTEALQYPTKLQKLVKETGLKMGNVRSIPLSPDELKFWKKLREICLLPEQAAFNHSTELAHQLSELRQQCFIVLFVANVLWMVVMVTIINQGSAIDVLGTSFAGVAFTFINAFLLIVQFLSLLVHRVKTFIHFLARAPFTPGHCKGNWTWEDAGMQSNPNEKELNDFRQRTLDRKNLLLSKYTMSIRRAKDNAV